MPLLLLTFVTPFVGAVIIAAIPSAHRNAIRMVAASVATITLALAIYIFLSYDYRTGGFQFQERYPWLENLGIAFQLGVDGISAPMVLLTGIVIFTGVLVSWYVDYRTKDFFILLFTLVTGVIGVFISLDLFFLFFFYELAVLPMYLLIGVWGSTRKEYGAMKLVIYLTAGSVLVWIGILALYIAPEAKTFDLLRLGQMTFSPDFQRLFFPFFLLGFGVLAGLWPFHTWSPDGHVAAPTAVSMLHAGVLMKLGAYGIIRVGVSILPYGATVWMPVLVLLATVNVLYGAFSAMAQRDLKFVIGYSSISHMGYVLMGFGTLSVVGVSGAVLQMFSHGVMTALFFALVGMIYDRAHTREISAFGGLAHRMGLVSVFFVVAGLTSLGLPGLSGFVAELLIFIGTFQTYPIIGVLAIIGAAVTAVYILRLLATVFFGPFNTRWENLRDGSRVELFAAAVLVGVLVYVGVYPTLFVNIISSGVGPLLERVAGVG
ncbi:MAG: NADH-quinone oxidoreductase subunit M [Chloroflexi bacterium]|nr:NADH-quinone oxidoreductase subunit M [Chloroflexota bacterium]